VNIEENARQTQAGQHHVYALPVHSRCRAMPQSM